MNCMKRKKYTEDKRIHPLPNKKEEKVDHVFMDAFIKEIIPCGACKGKFSIDSGELKIHCNICNQFYHCGIAGECIGEDCRSQYEGGHRARYCIGCVSKIYISNECLCNECPSPH